ncbi:uncharacterized protein [Equus przewalskii]|uniref:Uncharacterized protein isoform X12 n=1 Tax=Equus przewalskii TaxID=9798 RepID=A0ABM4P9Q2_EQUPR
MEVPHFPGGWMPGPLVATPLQAPLSSVPSCRARIRRLHPSVRQFVGGRAGGKDMPGAGRQKGEAGAWWRSRKIVL